MNKRRTFIQQLLLGGSALAAYPWMSDYLDEFVDLNEEKDAERFWKKVRKQYSLSKDLINLNNAGVNPHPNVVRDAVIHYEKMSNKLPSHFMWRVIDKDKDLVKEAIGDFIGCSKDDIAIQRNATEAMETIIFGLPLKKGDEVVLSKHDYPHMKFAWKQRAKRDGVKLKWVEMKLPSSDPNYIINQYKSQITQDTKLVCITHITNWNGQVIPVKEISKYAKTKGADVLVDAAHTIGQRPINVSDLEVDYLASSLHKWLGAPFGTGILYVKKGKRKDIYPLLAGPNPKSKLMNKFEHLGTRSVSLERAILPAIVFCNSLGVQRKMERLQTLKTYVVERIKDLSGVKIQSPIDLVNGSAILLFSLDGWDNAKLSKELMDKWKIHTTISENEGLSGIRISPNVFTLFSELDAFVEAIRTLSIKK